MSRKQKSISVDPAVFSCITMLVIAVGADKSAMTKDIKELIDSMFAAGLRFVTDLTNLN